MLNNNPFRRIFCGSNLYEIAAAMCAFDEGTTPLKAIRDDFYHNITLRSIPYMENESITIDDCTRLYYGMGAVYKYLRLFFPAKISPSQLPGKIRAVGDGIVHEYLPTISYPVAVLTPDLVLKCLSSLTTEALISLRDVRCNLIVLPHVRKGSEIAEVFFPGIAAKSKTYTILIHATSDGYHEEEITTALARSFAACLYDHCSLQDPDTAKLLDEKYKVRGQEIHKATNRKIRIYTKGPSRKAGTMPNSFYAMAALFYKAANKEG